MEACAGGRACGWTVEHPRQVEQKGLERLRVDEQLHRGRARAEQQGVRGRGGEETLIRAKKHCRQAAHVTSPGSSRESGVRRCIPLGRAKQLPSCAVRP